MPWTLFSSFHTIHLHNAVVPKLYSLELCYLKTKPLCMLLFTKVNH